MPATPLLAGSPDWRNPSVPLPDSPPIRFSSGTKSILSERTTDFESNFKNYGSSIGFKHLYAKPGRELTADVNLNKSDNSNNGGFNTQYFDINKIAKGNPINQAQEGKGGNTFYTAQVDFTNPISSTSKINKEPPGMDI
ncbi:MAG: hypothetical protein EB101_10975 [Chitinophagia bacterium]|nr:hypothetical protein [Chitinophagia bacterium]